MKTRGILLLGLLLLTAGCEQVISAGRASKRELTRSASRRELDQIATLYDKGDAAGAAGRLDPFVQRHPEDDLAWTILGHARKDLGNLDGAEEAYRKALEINPRRVQAITGLGILARKRGDDDEALAHYERAVSIDPKYAQAYTSMTVIAIKRRDDAKALEYARKAWELDRSDPTIAANLAVAYHYNGQTEMRDRMTDEARKLGYRKIDALRQIFSGELTVRD